MLSGLCVLDSVGVAEFIGEPFIPSILLVDILSLPAERM